MTVAYRCDLLAYRCGGSVGIELLSLVRVAPTSRLILLSVPADPEAARSVVADSKTPEAAATLGDWLREVKLARPASMVLESGYAFIRAGGYLHQALESGLLGF